MSNHEIYYFGVWEIGGAGHYLHTQTSRCNFRAPEGFPIARFETLDGGFLPSKGSKQGRVHQWSTRDWKIFSFIDQTGDPRQGSVSCFVIKSTYTESGFIAFQRALAAFPHISERVQSILDVMEIF